jgi:hypothetical protein
LPIKSAKPVAVIDDAGSPRIADPSYNCKYSSGAAANRVKFSAKPVVAAAATGMKLLQFINGLHCLRPADQSVSLNWLKILVGDMAIT